MPKGQKGCVSTIAIASLAVVIFILDCAFFHLPLESGVDAVVLAALILIPGIVFTNIFRRQFQIELNPVEVFSLSSATGFGFAAIAALAFHSMGWPIIAIYAVLALYLLIGSFSNSDGRLRIFHPEVARPIGFFILFTLAFFAAYNLECFHFAANGEIATRGLFGVDIPFLAGEIHGIQDFRSLRDLHQSAMPWIYHDWTYQLLAILQRKRTLADLAFASPLVSYSLLAISLFALALRFTKKRFVAYFSVAGWFLISGLQGGELGSYALSPSFVFGSIIFLNSLLLFDLLCKEKRSSQRWVVSAILLFLLFELSRTKLSSFLVLTPALGIAGLILLRRNRIAGIHSLVIAAISLTIFVVSSTRANPLMPTGDFLIGAPLIGYANHISAIFHLSEGSLNPVSKGFHCGWQSFLILPFFIFHFLRFALQDAKMLSAVIVFLAFRKYLWKEYGDIVWPIVLLIPLGFLMPVLYSPAWYPLALSFYAPIVSEQAALLLVALGFGILHRAQVTRTQRAALGVVLLIFFAGLVLNIRSIEQDDTTKSEIISLPLESAMNYLSNASSDTDIVASRQFDLDSAGDESYYWFSALSSRSVVSEGAKYGSLLAAVADTNSEKGIHAIEAAKSLLLSRRKLLDKIYLSRDTGNVRAAIAETRVAFIIEDSANGMALSIDPRMVGDRVFDDGGYKIWKVIR